MPRSIWTGAISFGLVSVPVKMYSAVKRKSVAFHQLNKATGSRISMRRVDASTGEEVPYEDIVKGYELSGDRHVMIEPAELEALEPIKTKTIEIQDFVALDEIDPIFYDQPYYLAPAAGGAKPYRLLLEAMRETNRVGIAKVVIRSKESLVALRPMGDRVLGMSTMVFADEVVSPDTLEDLPDDVEVADRELQIAKQLVESLAADFDPDSYRDTYRGEILALIERKASGEAIAVQPPVEAQDAPVPDLMAALKASLEAAKSAGGGKRAGTGKAPAKKAPAAAGKPAAKKPAAKKPAAKK